MIMAPAVSERPPRRLLPYGPDAVLIECADSQEVLDLAAAVRERFADRLTEIVPGAGTVLVQGRLTDALRAEISTLPAPPRPPRSVETIELATAYDGDDLAEVARLTGLTEHEVVAAHTDQTWTVAFCGFSPGFGYLAGENDRLRVPRRSSPRSRVLAGSVGLADAWSGVYPGPAPGGWQIIGHTDAVLWDPEQDPPAVLAPGTRVRFVPA